MITDLLYLVAGIVLLIAGGNYLTDGAVAVARRFKVSSLMIGLTVVALGSSMPDIAVCVESAIEGKTAIAVGDIVGANIFDLLLVVGAMALWRPWEPGRMMLTRDLPMLFLSLLSLWFVADSQIFDGAHTNVINRSAGMMLIVVFIFYMWITVMSARMESTPGSLGSPASGVSQRAAGSVTAPASRVGQSAAGAGSASAGSTHTVASAHAAKGEGKGHSSVKKPWLSWLMIIGGLGALVVGGNWVVDGASGLALKAGMSQGMVALTVVAIGNSLPDLVTSLTATAKGQPGLAFGNIVGACVIDALLALGISASITPLGTGTVGFFDFITLVGSGLLVWLLPYTSRSHKMPRWSGVMLIAFYVAYMAIIISRG
ncbi:MAG: sodium:calcium antiporter [Bacteroides sp.]|nr:sodium:calcium antiporter [Bacteroides sp.]